MTMISGFLSRLSIAFTPSHFSVSSRGGGGFVATLNVMHWHLEEKRGKLGQSRKSILRQPDLFLSKKIYFFAKNWVNLAHMIWCPTFVRVYKVFPNESLNLQGDLSVPAPQLGWLWFECSAFLPSCSSLSANLLLAKAKLGRLWNTKI